MEWKSEFEGLPVIVTELEDHWNVTVSPTAEIDIREQDGGMFDAFCFFGDFSESSEIPEEIKNHFLGFDLDSNGIQAVVTLTNVPGVEIVDFVEEHYEFIGKF